MAKMPYIAFINAHNLRGEAPGYARLEETAMRTAGQHAVDDITWEYDGTAMRNSRRRDQETLRSTLDGERLDDIGDNAVLGHNTSGRDGAGPVALHGASSCVCCLRLKSAR